MSIKWNLGEVANNQIYNVNNKKKILCFSHRQMMKNITGKKNETLTSSLLSLKPVKQPRESTF